jgi:hypothetical protein
VALSVSSSPQPWGLRSAVCYQPSVPCVTHHQPATQPTNVEHNPTQPNSAGKEYSKADSRYATRDDFVISMEAVTGVCVGGGEGERRGSTL